MNDTNKQAVDKGDDLYEEYGYWHVNTGDKTVHAKRMPGKFRTIKWITHALWLTFFLGPYVRWEGRQAILFDIPGRKFHFLDLTIMPQDVWMLSLVLLFMAITLFAVTAIAGRVFCGYFCFQTAWTDLFTWIEQAFEGNPAQRRKLDDAPWNGHKIVVKTGKHVVWLLIAMLTGVSFAAWFTDAYGLWGDLLSLNAHPAAWATLGLFTAGTYVLAGHMREQTCFWLCPYARIQGVMYDSETILPAYDTSRGEPRGKLVKGQQVEGNGDCIDCHQCVAVCPTGIDIRNGQQEGCITCGLCIDACDSVMSKIDKPKGLVRYASLDELEGKPAIALFKRPRVLIYFTVMTIALSGIIYGLTHLGVLELRAIHERQPLYVRQSDGTIQNKYDLKMLNKTDEPILVTIEIEGPDGAQLHGVEGTIELRPNDNTTKTVFVRIPFDMIEDSRSELEFYIRSVDNPEVEAEYESMFFAPEH